MTYFIQPIITKAGASNISAAIANKQVITFTRFSLGSGRIKTNIENATNVAKEVHTIAAAQTLDDAESPTFRILGRLDNTDIDTELTINEIGIFAKVGNGAEFMYMYTWAETGDIIPPGNAGNVYRDYDFATTISRDATVTIKFENPEQIYTTHAEMLAFEDIVNKKIDSIDINEVEKAKKLSNARTIALNGKATGSTTFDGSKNVSINVDIKTATTKDIGLTRLDDNANSTDTTKAATGHAVGVVNKAFSAHQSDNNKHITSSERTKWNGKADLNYTQSELSKKADKSVAQMYKLTEERGDLKKLGSLADVDNVIETGFYYTLGSKNVPGQKYGWLFVFKRDVGEVVTQFYLDYHDMHVYNRIYQGTVWGRWNKQTTDTDLSTKADIDKAQMFKFTSDDGTCPRLLDIDGDFKNGCWYMFDDKSKNAPFSYYYLFQFKRYTGRDNIQIAISPFGEGIKIRHQKGKWSQLATTTTTDKLRTDLAKAQVRKLTTDDGYSLKSSVGNDCNNYNLNGQYWIEAPINAWTINGGVQGGIYLEVFAKDKDNCMQVGRCPINSTVMQRVKYNGTWFAWHVPGFSVKTYDIVMVGGIKPSKYATGYDNKIVVYDGVAHLKLNLDATKASTARIFIPKEVAIQVKSSPTTYHDGNIHMNSAAVGWAHYETEDEKKTLKVINHEAEKEMLWLNIPNNGCDWVTATDLRVRNYNQKTDHHVGYFSWYVGGVN